MIWDRSIAIIIEQPVNTSYFVFRVGVRAQLLDQEPPD